VNETSSKKKGLRTICVQAAFFIVETIGGFPNDFGGDDNEQFVETIDSLPYVGDDNIADPDL
jgi:hypothetical protein